MTKLSVQKSLSYAIWKKPGSNRIMMTLANTTTSRDELSPEHEGAGFALAPFDPAAKKLFLPADHLFEFSNEESIEMTSGDLLDQIGSLENNTTCFHPGPSDGENESATPYAKLVEACISYIKSGEVSKLVPSRCKRIELKADADPIILLERLCANYPDAFVSMVSTPESGTWIGASPEPLIEVDSANMLRTVALAGTKPYHEGMSLSAAAWTQKEIEEQALVERYIIGCFKKIRVREYDEFGPRTVRAGNLIHLRSDFFVDQQEVRYPDLATVMLRLMHPTSAVCGTPGDKALEFLQKYEGYNRRYYAGFLGPVNIGNETNLFVNLRCMKWLGNEAVLFAGAGVTAGSNPDQEWQETRIKMDTLRKFI
ncbi:MAG: chorismate-binding protein [Bacteroidota bacterium]